MVFGLSDTVERERRRDHTTFYCPAGHRQHFPGESDLEREQRLAKNASQRAVYAEKRLDCEKADHQDTKNSLRATKGAHTRTKNRIHNGVCPHCKRHFANVRRHMASQHPKECADE